ncbi:sulfite reductase subunit alpha [Variovorax sp. J22G21]|uniref:sulfite reductase subunit alpha n=1 Tax=Variovorax fucosicus TaxID=3053517 RepID=UPI0025761453|nr:MULTISPECIES: sulfite reductase subunit alpha [unclassified Variovorax]MDM0040596.1 sulfite reductase subunit alpha [Variovorax sp. J22R193]MDM0061969.1 sulfite reductase subunit alpha [Variovorax sp. J22G21]
MSIDAVRSAAAGGTVLAYSMLCATIWWRERRRHAATAAAASALAGTGAAPALVLFATQTGQAETLAWQTADGLHADGSPVRVLALNALDADTLRAAPRALFIASTYGEGDAPDGASLFVEKLMTQAHALPALRYAVLALGDRQYQNFCGFGRQLDEWLQASGAMREFERIDVDNADPSALARWQRQLGIGDGAVAEIDESPFAPWQLTRRELLNPGSIGSEIHRLVLTPPAGATAGWQSGDLVQIEAPGDPARPREYSIASIVGDGAVELLVRQELHPDGRLGIASGWLTTTLSHGSSVSLRLKPHANFRLGDNTNRPLLLIGNGTGLAGLRSHLRARAAAGQGDNWLLFGERNAAHDWLCREEIEAWRSAGLLRRVDMVFSRDQPERLYVQHRLLQAADEVAAWIDRGAAIYVCGSLQGMASGVHAALRQIAGPERFAALVAAGRYRRDVY